MTARPGHHDAPPNTRNSTHTHQTMYSTETIRTVVREWATLRRAGHGIQQHRLATALDNLLAEYKS